MKASDILRISIEDVAKMNTKQLKAITQKLNKVANERIKNIKVKNVSSKAVEYINKNGGAFSTKGKNLNELRAEFKRVRGFLNSKTSTLRGIKQVKKTFEHLIGGSLTKEQEGKLWETYNKLNELNPHFMSQYGSKQALQMLHSEITQNEDISVDELIKKGNDEIQAMYDDMESDFNDMGEFFTL